VARTTIVDAVKMTAYILTAVAATFLTTVAALWALKRSPTELTDLVPVDFVAEVVSLYLIRVWSVIP
tara:strand:+ start:368 stop:568 length:201 start_codon:yes stop_codon:yes gene_type:complete